VANSLCCGTADPSWAILARMANGLDPAGMTGMRPGRNTVYFKWVVFFLLNFIFSLKFIIFNKKKYN
jgi:hypothetical protein